MIKHRRNEDSRRLLIEAITSPESLGGLNIRDWDTLLRIARRARLVDYIAHKVRESGQFDAIPPRVTDHLNAASRITEQRQQLAAWELNRITWALEGLDVRPVLLKGAAYLVLGLPNSPGRLLADVDILVPRSELSAVERALNKHGWEAVKMNPYDQRYYREWMHELPPLRHNEREMEVDLHHTILPLTSRLKPNPELLFANARAVPDGIFKTLSPVDMVLHAATHLFYDSDLADAVRDLVDVHELLSHFAGTDGFWEALAPRARQMDLLLPLFYGLRYARRFLQTAVPQKVLSEAAVTEPSTLRTGLMDSLVPRALFPPSPDYPGVDMSIARWLLYVRSHWLRMQPWLLARHLARKSWRRIQLPGKQQPK